MDRFEYKQLVITSYDSSNEIDRINELGLKGWELVGFTTFIIPAGILSDTKGANQYIFKRKLQ